MLQEFLAAHEVEGIEEAGRDEMVSCVMEIYETMMQEVGDEDSDDETFDDLRIRSPPVRQKTAGFCGAVSHEKISFATTGSGQAQGKLKKSGVFRRLS